MGRVKIRKREISGTHRILDVIAILLGILIVLAFAFGGGALRSNALNKVYGSFAPVALIVFIVVLIMIYLKFEG